MTCYFLNKARAQKQWRGRVVRNLRSLFPEMIEERKTSTTPWQPSRMLAEIKRFVVLTMGPLHVSRKSSTIPKSTLRLKI